MLTGCAKTPAGPTMDLPELPPKTEQPAEIPPPQPHWTCIGENLYSLDYTGDVTAVRELSDRLLVFSAAGVTAYDPSGEKVGEAALGSILWYSEQPLESGLLPLVRGTGALWQEVLYLDPVTLTCTARPLPVPGEYYGLHISPAGSYAALSTFEGLQIWDGDFKEKLMDLPVTLSEGEHPERRTLWAETWFDDHTLTARFAEPDLVRCPAVIDLDRREVRYLTDLDLCQGRLLDADTVLWHNYFSFAPAGVYDLQTGTRTEIVYLDTLEMEAMTAMAFSDETVALAYLTGGQARISVMTLRRGFKTAGTAIPQGGTVDQLSFSPDGTTLYALFTAEAGETQVLRLALS